MLARIIAALHDENGRVTVPGFYDGVKELPADIKAELKALNLTPEEFLGQVGLKVPAGEKDRMLIEQISTRPTCDVNGIIGGYTGEGAKTVIAAQATAKISFRLVGDAGPGEDPRCIPRLRARALPGGREGRVHQSRLQPGAAGRLRKPGARQGARGADRGVGHQGGRGRLGRLDPDRRRFQDRARHGHAAGRLRRSTTTACIRRTRNTTSPRSTRARAPGRASSRRWRGKRGPLFPGPLRRALGQKRVEALAEILAHVAHEDQVVAFLG